MRHVRSALCLRHAAMPIFTAWTRAVPLLDADGRPQAAPASAHSDVPILVGADTTGAPHVDDFGYRFTDADGHSYWKLASGHDVKDAQGHVIAQPTFEQVMARTTSHDIRWRRRHLDRRFGQS